MYEKLVEGYINALTKEDIQIFAEKKGIKLSEKDTTILYEYAKKHWRTFLKGDPSSLFMELEKKLDHNTFQKAKQLYIEAKNKFLK